MSYISWYHALNVALRQKTEQEQHDAVVHFYREDRITDWHLWILLSSEWPLRASVARKIYQTLGFIPFSGYPPQK